MKAPALDLPVWPVSPLDDVPRLRLASWRVVQTDTGERHLVGRNLDDDEGRVSSAIVAFNAKERAVTTSSGRLYQLVGMPGHDADAEMTWRYWADFNGVKQTLDVTAEVEAAITAAQTKGSPC